MAIQKHRNQFGIFPKKSGDSIRSHNAALILVYFSDRIFLDLNKLTSDEMFKILGIPSDSVSVTSQVSSETTLSRISSPRNESPELGNSEEVISRNF